MPTESAAIILTVETVVGIGTLALAVMTGALAVVAWQSLVAQRVQTERAYRPVIVPLSSRRTVEFRSGTINEAPAGPAMHDDRLVIAVENVGMGPALNVRGLVELGGAGSAVGWGRTLHAVEGIAAGTANAVVFWKDEGVLTPQVEVQARLAYEDVAGVTYWTDIDYNVSTHAYHSRVIGHGVEPPSPLVNEKGVEDILPASRWPTG